MSEGEGTKGEERGRVGVGTAAIVLPPSSLLFTSHDLQLLTTHSVAMLRQYARERRHQAAEKKNELRMLVGKRYRVLLESADSIIEMNRLARQNEGLLERIRDNLLSFSDRDLLTLDAPLVAAPARASSGDHLPDDDGATAKTVLETLIFIPDIIWQLLDVHEASKAVGYFLDAEELHSWFQFHSSTSSSASASALPDDAYPNSASALYAPRHLAWLHFQSIQQVPERAQRACRDLLRKVNLPARGYADILCALSVLATRAGEKSGNDGSALEYPLTLLLKSRESQLRTVIDSGRDVIVKGAKNGLDVAPTAARALQISIEIVCGTLDLVSELFVSSSSAIQPSSTESRTRVRDLLRDFWMARRATRKHFARKSANGKMHDDDKERVQSPWCPTNVPDIAPALVHQHVGDWMNVCIPLLSEAVELVFAHLRTGTQLGMVRDAVLNSLSGEDEISRWFNQHLAANRTPSVSDVTTKRMSQLRARKHVNLSALGKSFNMWEMVFAVPFASRSQIIMQDRFGKLMLEWPHAHVRASNKAREVSPQPAKNPFDVVEYSKEFTSPKRRSLVAKQYALAELKRLKSKQNEVSTFEAAASKIEENGDEADNELEHDIGFGAEQDALALSVSGKFTEQLNELLGDLNRMFFLDGAPVLALLLDLPLSPAVAESVHLSLCPASLTKSSLSPSPPATAAHTFSDSLVTTCQQTRRELQFQFRSLRSVISDSFLLHASSAWSAAISRIVKDASSLLKSLQDELLYYDDAQGEVSSASLSPSKSKSLQGVSMAALIGRVASLLRQKRIVTHALEAITSLSAVGLSSVTSASPTKYAELGEERPSLQVDKTALYVKNALEQLSEQGLRVWTRHAASDLAEWLESTLRSWLVKRTSLTPGAERKSCVWSTAPEEGSFAVPSHPSSYVHRFTHKLLEHAFAPNGFNLQKELRDWLIADVAVAVSHALSHCLVGGKGELDDVSTPEKSVYLLPQASCLQLIFDMQYLASILNVDIATDYSRSKASQPLQRQWHQIMSSIEQRVDPIDYAVGKDAIIKNVKAQLVGSAVLVGVLLNVTVSASKPFQHPQLKNHPVNVLPVVPVVELGGGLKSLPVALLPSKVKSFQSAKVESKAEAEVDEANRLAVKRPLSTTSQLSLASRGHRAVAAVKIDDVKSKATAFLGKLWSN